MSDNDTFQQGVSLLQKWYNDECRACAKAVIDEAKRHGEDEDDVLREMIDNHEFIVYTFKARLVIALSEHSGAYEDEMGEPATTDEARACFAMIADVREYLDAVHDEESEES